MSTGLFIASFPDVSAQWIQVRYGYSRRHFSMSSVDSPVLVHIKVITAHAGPAPIINGS